MWGSRALLCLSYPTNSVQNEYDVITRNEHRRKNRLEFMLGLHSMAFVACELKETRGSFGYIHNSKREAFFLDTSKSITEIREIQIKVYLWASEHNIQ